MDFLTYNQALFPNIPAVLIEKMHTENQQLLTNWQLPSAQQLNDSPGAWWIPNLLNDAECDHLIDLATGKLEFSKVVDNKSGEALQKTYRTSRHMFLSLHHDEVVKTIEAKIAALLQIPFEYGDGLQILNYQIGQEYKPHHDYFYPDKPNNAKLLALQGQRAITLLMYLNDVEAGGETELTEINLKVPPQKGCGFLFYNLHPDGNPNPASLHASRPVTQGEKWVATKWINERNFYESLEILKASGGSLS